MKEKKSTRERLEKMIEGLVYHCRDMTDFMSETVNDPYFDTEEGKKMRRYMVGILTNHVMALTEFMTSDMIEKKGNVESEESKFSLEDFLKDSFK